MGYVVEISTLTPMTYEQAQQRENQMEIETDGGIVIGSGLTLGFSEEGLEGTRWAMIDTGDMPILEPIYYKLELGPVTEIDGKYRAEWIPLPSDFPIEKIAEKKLADMQAECSKDIEAGFYSSALGAPHRYSSDRDSQTNMQWNLFAAMVGESVSHICYDAEGVRAEREHTAEQMIHVSRDFGGHIWPKLRKYGEIRAQIESATDKAALIAISWA